MISDAFNFCDCVFAGDIGGQMGLFIGASVLTILELFDYLYEVRLINISTAVMSFNLLNGVCFNFLYNKMYAQVNLIKLS